jgi:hypothetical protein
MAPFSVTLLSLTELTENGFERLRRTSPLGSSAMRLDEILQMLLAGDHGGRIALGFRVKSVFIKISILRARPSKTKACQCLLLLE